jgi:hypothetical protein
MRFQFKKIKSNKDLNTLRRTKFLFFPKTKYNSVGEYETRWLELATIEYRMEEVYDLDLFFGRYYLRNKYVESNYWEK